MNVEIKGKEKIMDRSTISVRMWMMLWRWVTMELWLPLPRVEDAAVVVVAERLLRRRKRRRRI